MTHSSLSVFRLMALTAAMGWCTTGFAESLPQVTATVPGFGADMPGENASIQFDRLLPASVPFELRVPAPSTGGVSGTVKFWANEETGAVACPNSAPKAAKQSHELRMTAAGSNEERVLRSELPALQVAQAYCFHFDLKRSPTDAELARFAEAATLDLLRKLLLPPNGGPAPTSYAVNPAGTQAFVTALNAAAHVTQLTGNTHEAAELALREYATSGTASSYALLTALSLQTNLVTQVAQLSAQRVASQTALAAATAPGPQSAPLVIQQGVPVLTSTLIGPGATDSVLRDALSQISARNHLASPGKQQVALKSWVDWLSNLLNQLDSQDEPARQTSLKAAQRELKTPGRALPSALPVMELFSGTEVVAVTDYQKMLSIPPDSVLTQLQTRAGEFQNVQPFINAVLNYIDVQKSQAEATSELAKNQGVVAEQTTAVRSALKAAFASTSTRGALAVALDASAVSRAGSGMTPSPTNYASVDAGVAVALPNGSHAQRAWVLPYLGLNLYAVPVDRTIPLGDLAGNTFWQRVSLTIGMTLTEPGLRGRTIHSVLLDNYPLAALGFRVSHFTRLIAGGVFYFLDSANPASNDIVLHVAPFIGASLDIDVVHLLTQAEL